MRSPLPLLRLGGNRKALINLLKIENDMDALQINSNKVSKSLLGCTNITAFVASGDAKAFHDT